MSTERAVLAGGCFWGMQELIRHQDGVVSTRVGYTGGDVQNATYRNHDGHAEAIEVIFDPARTSYRTLLEFFFQIHDPSTPNRQGNDRGSSYRSAVFYTSEARASGLSRALSRRLHLPLHPTGLEAAPPPGPGHRLTASGRHEPAINARR
jgi:methionine-S-sulfoxide reductase